MTGKISKFLIIALACFGLRHFVVADDSQGPRSPFLHGKVQINMAQASSIFMNQTATEPTLEAGSELAILIDHDCTDSMAQEDPSRAGVAMQFYSGNRPAAMGQKAYDWQLNSDMKLSELTDQVENDDCVIGVAEKMVMSINQFNDDPQFGNQEHLTAIRATEGHKLFYESSAKLNDANKVVIAIVDTGVNYNHQDLQNVMWEDGQGSHGFDFINNDNDPIDDQGHGTHVAGLAAAQSSNGVGVSGVMGFHAEIMGVKTLSAQGSGSNTAVANGIRWAADNGADVINMSLGGAGASALIRDALVYAVGLGSTVVVAAGNDGQQLTAGNFYSPASYGRDYAGVITVGSIDAVSLNRSGFSNFSTTYVEIGSPGSRAGTPGVLATGIQGNYIRLQGTSMACPVAAGATGLVIGLLKANGIDPDPALVEEVMLNGALKDNSLANTFLNGNRVDMPTLISYIENSVLTLGDAGLEDM